MRTGRAPENRRSVPSDGTIQGPRPRVECGSRFQVRPANVLKVMRRQCPCVDLNLDGAMTIISGDARSQLHGDVQLLQVLCQDLAPEFDLSPLEELRYLALPFSS